MMSSPEIMIAIDQHVEAQVRSDELLKKIKDTYFELDTAMQNVFVCSQKTDRGACVKCRHQYAQLSMNLRMLAKMHTWSLEEVAYRHRLLIADNEYLKWLNHTM